MTSRKSTILALLLALAAVAWGQKGPVTSNLKRVLVYIYGYSGGDHQNTTQYAGHLIALGKEHNFTVDTTRSHGAFTPANLANYQAVVLFSAYNFGASMTATQKDALKAWFAGNRGLACFHQCAKNSFGGSPNWFDILMGVRYQTYAGFKTGPVFVNADVVGTDLAMSSAGTAYTADHTQSWDDEWYTYQANPDPLPNTKVIWTTKKSAINLSGGSGFYLPGDIQPMAWAREVEGGRFVMNSMFHRDAPRISTNPELRQFIDGAFLGTMRYIAGYTGCTDPEFPAYNPKATHHDPGACATTVTFDNRSGGAAGVPGNAAGRIQVSVTPSGPHTVEIFDVEGRVVWSRRGDGPAEYGFTRSRPGMHYVRIRAGGSTVSKRILLL